MDDLKPIDLNVEREARREQHDGQVCAQCGCAWFDAVVVFSPGGAICGFSTNPPPKCHECGRAAHPIGVV